LFVACPADVFSADRESIQHSFNYSLLKPQPKSMKKNLPILLFLFCLLNSVHAQITITQSDMPVAGTHWAALNDHTGSGITLTSPGSSSQAWNYASSFTVVDTSFTLFQNASAVPGHANYPGSTLGIEIISPGVSGGEFLTVNANGLYIDGFSENISGVITAYTANFTNYQVFPTPITYGTNSMNLSRSVTVVEYDTSFHQPLAKTITHTTRNIYSDAWGTITTPSMTNVSVIRVVEKNLGSVDSTYADSSGTGNNYVFTGTTVNAADNMINYYFLGHAPNQIVMEVGYDTAAQAVVSGSYYNNTLTTGIPENTSVSIAATVYPNPSSSATINFRINNENTARLLIYDSIGKLNRELSVEGTDHVVLSTSILAKGIYIYKTIDKEGTLLSTGKFVLTN
jgi:hypothetical protein